MDLMDEEILLAAKDEKYNHALVLKNYLDQSI